MTGNSVLAVSTTTGRHLDFFDPRTLEHLGRLDGLVAQPHEIAWDRNRQLMYLTHTYRGGGYGEGQPAAYEISVIDPFARDVVDVIDISPYLGPHDVAYDPHRDLIYAGVEAHGGRNGLVIIDGATRTVVDHVPLPERNAHWIALTPDGRSCFVTHKEAETVSVVDLERREVVASIHCPGGAEEVDCSPDGRFAYVASPLMSVTVNVTQGALNRKPPKPGDPTPRLLQIDTRTHEVVASTDFDEIVCALKVEPGGDILVSAMHFPDPDAEVAAPVPGTVHRVSADTMEIVGHARTGELPFTIRCTAAGDRAFVANLKSGTVTVVALPSMERVADLDNHLVEGIGGSHGLCVIEEDSTPGRDVAFSVGASWPVPPGRMAPLTEPDEEQEEALAKTPSLADGRRRNIFLTLGWSPMLLKRFNVFTGYFMRFNRLSDYDRELVVLRVAATVKCAYELGQHLPIARAAGLSEPTIAAAVTPPATNGLSGWEQTLLAFADEMVRDGAVSDETWTAVSRVYNEAELVELTTLVGLYRMVGDTLNVLGVPLEDGTDLRVGPTTAPATGDEP